MSKPLIAVISGVKNSGKTTLITKLIPVLNAKGYRTAVIKHDGHDFSCDIPGTDTYRFVESGAYGTAIYSPYRMFVHKVGTGEREEDLIAMFPEADLILMEGFKELPFPKLEIIRSGVSVKPASNPEGRFLIVTDLPEGTFSEPCLGLEEIEEIASVILAQSEKK